MPKVRSPRTLAPILAVCLFVFCDLSVARAQPGTLDPDFYRYSVFDGVVFSLAMQLDGKALVGGAFNNVTGVPRHGMARVNRNGSLDTTFNPGLGVEGNGAAVYALTLYTNGTNAGKIIIAGSFTTFNRVARASLARLNADGTLDTSFNPGAGIQNGEVYAVALQADDKILVGGSFSSVQDRLRNGIARFTPDGALDTTFNPGTGADDTVFGVAVQPDSKIVVAGAFTTIQSVSRSGVARLTSTGLLDPPSSFDPGEGIDGGSAYALALQTDGRILVAGDFTSMQGAARDGVARLNSNGSLDTLFAPDSGGTELITVWALTPVTGGKVLVGGQFTAMGGTDCDGIARLDATGKQDPAFTNSLPDGVRFNVGHGEYIETMAVQTNDSVVVGGTFELVDNFYRAALARLGTNGDVDPLFNQESGTTFSVSSTAVQSDGKILLGGQFAYLNGASHTGLGRLQADGLVDDSFQADLNFSSRVNALALYTNGPLSGKILVGGTFTSVNGFEVSGLARVDNNGVVETDFNPVIQPGDIEALALQADGKIVIGGPFTNVNGNARNGIARLNHDGTLEPGFDPGAGIGGVGVYAVMLQTNNQIVIGGDITNFNGTPRYGLARLNANGGLDLTFDPGSGVTNGAVRAIVLQPDGRILASGGFSMARGAPRSGIARFKVDGTLDDTFNPGDGIGDGEIRALALQTNGQVLIGGSFTNYNHIPAGGVARLNMDGTFDYGFDPGTGLAYVGQVRAKLNALALQLDGKAVLGGAFVSVNGVGGGANGNFERLLGGPPIPSPPSLLFWPLAQTAVSGESVALNVVASGSKPLSHQWFFKSATLTGETNALLQLAEVSTNQGGAYSVIVTNAYGTATSPPIALKVIATVDLPQALDAPGLGWSSSGDRHWYGQTAISHDGVASGQSGPIADSEQSTLSATVVGPGRLSFWWKVSSEDGYDFFDFYVNGDQEAEITGEVGWVQRTFSIPSGQVTLDWVYSKDISNANGLDAGWVDQVSYTQAPALAPARLPDGRFQLGVDAAPGQVLQIQASITLTNWTTISALTNLIPPLIFVDDAATNFNWRFYRTLTP